MSRYPKVRGKTYRERMIRANSGFTKEERDAINAVLKTGASYARAARAVGMSPSSLYKTKKAGARPLGPTLRKRFVSRMDYSLKRLSSADTVGWEDDETSDGRFASAGVRTLLRRNDPSNPFRSASADDTYEMASDIMNWLQGTGRSPYQQAVEDGWGEYGTGEERQPTLDEFLYGGARIERPTITKSIRTRDGQNIRVSWKFGRGKSDEQRAYIQEQLDYYGIDESEWEEYYDEATGYTTGEK